MICTLLISFFLFEESSDGTYLKKWYSGGYLVVDNGYLDWPVLIPPLKSYISQKELRWSKWVESIRKDVECLFGIQKKRFKVLQSGIMVHGVRVTDKIWMTCSALHNFLIDENGDEPWDNHMNVNSDYARNIIPCTTDLNNRPIAINSLSRNEFRDKLINHFDILWKHGMVKWPSRSGLGNPPSL